MNDNLSGDPAVLAKLRSARPRRWKRWLWQLLGLCILAGLAAGVWFYRAKGAKQQLQTWVTEPAVRGDLRETVIATGTLRPLDAVEVGAEVTGRVTAVHVEINDPVKADQVLVEIDPEQLSARLEEAQAQMSSAQAAVRNAKATVAESEANAQRSRELHSRGLISDQQLEAAVAAHERATASVSTASAQVVLASAGVKSARTALDRAIIRSPIDGIVLARTVEVGQTVTAGFQTPVLFTLAKDISEMRLEIDVDEADVGKVREGQAASFVVDAYPGRRFESKVVRLHNLPREGTTVITYTALLTVDNTERLLRPGMTATATIVTSEKKDVLSVPNAALRFEPVLESAGAARGGGLPLPGMGRRSWGGPWRSGGERPAGPDASEREDVYVVQGGQLERVEVTIGGSDGRRTEIIGEGLKAGTPVVVDVEVSE